MGYDFVDLGIDDFAWVDDNTINFISTVLGVNKLFQFNINDKKIKSIFETDNLTSVYMPVKILNKSF